MTLRDMEGMERLDAGMDIMGGMQFDEVAFEGAAFEAAAFDELDEVLFDEAELASALKGMPDELSDDDLDGSLDEELDIEADDGADDGANEGQAREVTKVTGIESALEAVSFAATENSLESKIDAFLYKQRGESITNWRLAKEFGVSTHRCVKALKRLIRRERVRVVMVAGRRQYYAPTIEQWQKLQARQPKMRSTGEYKLPQPMVDLWNRIRTERASVPSCYGGAV